MNTRQLSLRYLMIPILLGEPRQALLPVTREASKRWNP